MVVTEYQIFILSKVPYSPVSADMWHVSRDI